MTPPDDALSYFIPRFEAFEKKVSRDLEVQSDEVEDLKTTVAVLLKENELTRRALDRFTNALIGGSISIVGAAVAVILFGPA